MRARATRRALGAVAMAAVLAGCASGLDVGYPETSANPALLAAAAPQRVALGPVTDRRLDRTRIGARPTNGKPIETSRPVADIVRDALAVELARNGHVVVPEGGDLRVTADVEDFWLETPRRDATTQYVGRVAIALAVADGRSGDTLLLRRYVGIKRLQAESDAKDAWRVVMDTALARTMHDVATDPAVRPAT